MALWGKSDDIYSPGTISVNYNTKVITGSGTSFTSASVGDVVSIGAGVTFGEAVISEVTSNTQISIASTQHLSGTAISGIQYKISQKPKYTLHDSNYDASEIYGVDTNEVSIASTTDYSVGHAGWVGITTYIDTHGNLRVKHEVLVAMSGISTGTAEYIDTSSSTYDEQVVAAGDSDDDVLFGDA